MDINNKNEHNFNIFFYFSWLYCCTSLDEWLNLDYGATNEGEVKGNIYVTSLVLAPLVNWFYEQIWEKLICLVT